jgi:hypothetical protein
LTESYRKLVCFDEFQIRTAEMGSKPMTKAERGRGFAVSLGMVSRNGKLFAFTRAREIGDAVLIKNSN